MGETPKLHALWERFPDTDYSVIVNCLREANQNLETAVRTIEDGAKHEAPGAKAAAQDVTAKDKVPPQTEAVPKSVEKGEHQINDEARQTAEAKDKQQANGFKQ